MAVLVGDILDRSAGLLNDVNKTQYTYAVMLPYYNIAQDDLQEKMELNNVPVTNERSVAITVPIATTVISFTSSPALPADLIEVQELGERLSGTSVDYDHMTRREFLPAIVEQTESLIWWTWQNQELRFIGATTPRQLQLDYIAARLPLITSTATPITLINARSFLQYRTAALCAEFVGENKVRADSLNGNALESLDSFLGISTKGRQAIAIRRRPFMAAYKNRGY
jgi:hypothetical protein